MTIIFPEKTGFYVVKIIAIFLVTLYYFIFGSIMSTFVNAFTPDRDVNKLSTLQLFFEIMISFGVIGILYYFLRKFIRNIPYPFDGFYGFQHKSLKEMGGGIIVAFVVFTYQTKLTERLIEFRNRLERIMKSF